MLQLSQVILLISTTVSKFLPSPLDPSFLQDLFYPCKNGTGILAGSCQDPAKIPAGIPPRFWPPGFLPGFLAGGGIPCGQNLGGIPVGILPGFLAGSGIPAAKISAGFQRESCRDSWRATGYLGGSVAGICDGKQNSLRSKSSRQPKSPGVVSGILPGFAMRTIININQTTRRWQNYDLYCSPKYCWHDCYQPCTCFLIELSLMWYYFHVTITRRQRIVHVHVMLLQRAEFNVVDWFPRSPWKPRGARSVAGGRRQVSFLFICCEIRSICRRITNEQEEFDGVLSIFVFVRTCILYSQM